MTRDALRRVEALVAGGDGLAREPGEPVTFIPGTAPGDLVRVRLEREGRGHDRGRILEILEPGPGRRAPPCPETAACGGCPWMHLTEPAQAEAARDILVAALQRAHVRVADGAVRATAVPAPVLRWRRRMRLGVDLRAGGQMGFRQARSHDVHDPAACLALHPALEHVRLQLREALPTLARVIGRLRGELQVDLPRDDGGALLLRLDREVTAGRLREGLETLRGAAPIITALAATWESGGSVRAGDEAVRFARGPFEEPERWPAFVSPGGFLQAGGEGNALLLSRVLATARSLGLGRGSRVLELYAGNGNLTLPLAGLGCEVEASDSDATAIANAERAVAEVVGELACRPRLLAEDAVAHVRRLVSEGHRFDAVVLDPPRVGAKEIAASLLALAPAILHVSCDAPTLARDLALAGAEVVSAEPLLLFPQTAHFETVVGARG